MPLSLTPGRDRLRSGKIIPGARDLLGKVLLISSLRTVTIPLSHDWHRCPVTENQAACIGGWFRHIRNGSAADITRAADSLTEGSEEVSPFLGGVVERVSLLLVVATEHRSGSSRFPIPWRPSLAHFRASFAMTPTDLSRGYRSTGVPSALSLV